MKGEQVFRAIWDLEADVNNGGCDQYYSNSSVDTAFAVVDALKEIGATQTADIVLRAHSVFPDGDPPRDRDRRQELLQRRHNPLGPEDVLEPLDQAFFAYPNDLTELLYAFVGRNVGQIGGAAELLA